ncbi:MAG: EcsC family protein [Myxococcota bacterium]|nr:EcsC family protein [Myxococcota bacterium]
MKAEEFATGILDALDEGLFQNVYRLASVELSEVVKDFQNSGSAVQDLADIRDLDIRVLDKRADRYIRRAKRSAALSGVSLGAAGWLALPPGLIHLVVVALRLAQRISLSYGFDYRTDRGEIELWKALAKAVDADVNWEGTEAELLRRLPTVVTGSNTFSNPLLLKAVQTVVVRLAAAAGLHASRWVPVVGSGTGLVINYLEVDRIGRRLKESWRTRHAIDDFDPSEAQEVEILR